MTTKKVFCAVVLSLCLTVSAEVQLPTFFADGMVLQQQSSVAVWGWGAPDTEITVEGSWENCQPVKTMGDRGGQWRVEVQTPKAGGPYTLTIQGPNTIVIRDVLIGEVWICSGQSNMQYSLKKLDTPACQKTIDTADYPRIRLFTVVRRFATEPRPDCKGQWQVCSPETVKDFSAVAFYFGQKLHEKLSVPIGLISTNWGGTRIEAWTSEEVLRPFGDYNDALDKLKTPAEHNDQFPNQNTPSVLYNKMVHPLLQYRIAGAIWYQGEANSRRNPVQYRTLFPAMIRDWRTRWGHGDFPFYYVQIAPYAYADPNALDAALLREAQMMTLKAVPNAGMAVTMDIGEENNIHPKNKQDVGDRLARWAFATHYGCEGIVCSGPLYKGMQVEGNAIRVLFDYAGSGLVARGGPLTDFEIAGSDRRFVPARAEIDGETILVSSDQVPEPAAVRYAFKNWAQPNLFNAEGLPASSFRTDDWPVQ